jgi:hypothetical protein
VCAGIKAQVGGVRAAAVSDKVLLFKMLATALRSGHYDKLAHNDAKESDRGKENHTN